MKGEGVASLFMWFVGYTIGGIFILICPWSILIALVIIFFIAIKTKKA